MSERRTMLSRRSVLCAGAAALALVATGCTVDTPDPPAPPPPDPLEALLEVHTDLLAQYDAAVSAQPDLAPRLAPLRKNIAEHVTALAGAQAIEPPSATATPTDAVSTSPSESIAPPPPDPITMLAALRASEVSARTATTEHIAETTVARAPLLGSIAACHACHEVLLS